MRDEMVVGGQGYGRREEVSGVVGEWEERRKRKEK